MRDRPWVECVFEKESFGTLERLGTTDTDSSTLLPERFKCQLPVTSGSMQVSRGQRDTPINIIQIDCREIFKSDQLSLVT